MIDYKQFISHDKSMLIAPAGFGKTHTISECLKETKEIGKQLILTHTHAGIASLKDKLVKANIKSGDYHIETITSFAQKYVLAFYRGKDIPEQSDSKQYYPFIIKKALVLLKCRPILAVISNSYKGVFVDEYQDCTIAQHDLIVAISHAMPVRVLGDHMQGIFEFNGEQLVNMEDSEHVGAFASNLYELEEPQRWMQSNNLQLGLELKEIRENLKKEEEIRLSDYPSIETVLVKEADLYTPRTAYNKKVSELMKRDNVLIIHPVTTSIHPRLMIIQRFNNAFTLIESIDDKSFYSYSKTIDGLTCDSWILTIIDLCHKLFNKTSVNNWFNDKGLKNKKGLSVKDSNLMAALKKLSERLSESISFYDVSNFVKMVLKLPTVKCYRRDLFRSLCQAMEEAEDKKITVLEAMMNVRNSVRRVGRKVSGRCIGTTLLTKGLEFDTVAIIDAHKFTCPKNFYVAITRGSKRLIIFTNNEVLKPYKS
jgi:DNA helicase-2/ATP-dependent DNA helicase PcrA